MGASGNVPSLGGQSEIEQKMELSKQVIVTNLEDSWGDAIGTTALRGVQSYKLIVHDFGGVAYSDM